MAIIALGTAPAASRGSVRDALDWARVGVATLARGLVITVLGLALWAAAPALLGWHPTTVMTGSMEPRLVPGDVVVSRPVAPEELRLGQVILYDDPDQVGELRLHRIHAVGKNGTLITKGDANPQPDSTPITRAVVDGVAFIRVPYIGTPIVWLRDGEWHRVVLLVLALTVIAWLSTIDGSLRRVAAAAASDGSDASGRSDGSDPDGSSDLPAGREGRDGTAPSLPSDAPPVAESRRRTRRRLRRARALRRAGTSLAVVLLVAGGGALLPAKALAATFATTTVNSSNSLTAGTAVAPTGLTCTNNSNRTVTISWTYAGSTVPAAFDVMNGSTEVASAAGTARSAVVAGSGMLNVGTTSALTVRTSLGGAWTATSSSSVSVKTTSVFGVATATCA